MTMRRWEIRRHFQETRPFDHLLFLAVLVEKLMDKGIMEDPDFMEMLRDHQLLTEQIPHYE
jgi:hypothetical protein